MLRVNWCFGTRRSGPSPRKRNRVTAVSKGRLVLSLPRFTAYLMTVADQFPELEQGRWLLEHFEFSDHEAVYVPKSEQPQQQLAGWVWGRIAASRTRSE